MADDDDPTNASLSFADFLERMKDPAAADLVRTIRACVADGAGRGVEGVVRLIVRSRSRRIMCRGQARPDAPPLPLP